MTTANNHERAIVIKFGGSYATTMEGANREYLHSFLAELIGLLQDYQRIGLVIGGGPRIRALQQTVDGDHQKNMIAREALWEHAEDLKSVIEELGFAAEPVPHDFAAALETLAHQTSPVVVVSWLADGQSTDTSAVTLAETWQTQGYEAVIVILSNVANIFTADPRVIPDAQPITHSSVQHLVEEGVLLNDPATFKPGMSVTIDPVAVSRLEAMGEKAPSVWFGNGADKEGVKEFIRHGRAQTGTTLIAP